MYFLFFFFMCWACRGTQGDWKFPARAWCLDPENVACCLCGAGTVGGTCWHLGRGVSGRQGKQTYACALCFPEKAVVESLVVGYGSGFVLVHKDWNSWGFKKTPENIKKANYFLSCIMVHLLTFVLIPLWAQSWWNYSWAKGLLTALGLSIPWHWSHWYLSQ